MIKNYNLLLFIEGFVVMFVQIACGMLLSFYAGNSLIVWTFVLSISMSSIAIGYFLGNYIQKDFLKINIIYSFLIFSLFYLSIIPSIIEILNRMMIEQDVLMGVLVICLITLTPILILLGSVPTGIGNILKQGFANNEGKSGGYSFFYSTIGGIIGALASALLIIPSLGIKNSIYLLVVTFLIIILYLLIKDRKLTFHYFLFVIGLFLTSIIFKTIESSTVKNNNKNKTFKILHDEFGVMGHLVVLEPIRNNFRVLSVNNIVQSVVDKNNGKSYFGYVQRIATFSSYYPINSDALVIGMGGSALVNEYDRLGYKVDVCELDKRIISVAKKYFGLSNTINCIVDDARHYLNICDKKYDLIVLDVSWAENQPSHLYTAENFKNIKNLLTTNGTFFLHYQGSLKNENLEIIQNLNQTLNAAGFSTKLLRTAPDTSVAERIFECKLLPNTKKVSDLRLKEYLSTLEYTIKDDSILYSNLNTNLGEIFTDNQPKLDILERNTSLLKRKNSRAFLKDLMNQGYVIK